MSSNFVEFFDVFGEGYDFFVVGFQEVLYFDVKIFILDVLGEKYWCEFYFF